MIDQERINKINNLLDRYYKTEDSFEQTDLAIKLIQGHVDWLIEQAKQVSELKKENEWLDGREKIDKQNAVLSIQLRDLQQENARFQQALESIGYKGFNVEPKRIVVKMQSLARKALEESK